MADITAAVVMKLRKMSGQGMMDCKAALKETDGDLEAAMDILRKKGLATMEKRAGRDTTEGRVVCKKSDDGKTAIIVSLCCETDFASKSDGFVAASETLADYAVACQADEGAEALLNSDVDGKAFSEVITDLVSKTGEKTEVGDYTRLKVSGSGLIGSYIHFNNKVGAMIEVETSSDEVAAQLDQVASEICMHATAMNPAGLDRDGIPAEVIQKEREIAAEQLKGKPAEIMEKILDGKIAKFFKDNCLVDQVFVKDDTMTVSEALNKAAKAAGGEAKIKRLVRIGIG